VITLDSQQSLRIERSGGARVACASGVVWLTREDDPRDFILAHGEMIELVRGLTMVTALEPSVVSVEKTAGGSWWREIGKTLRTGLQRLLPRATGVDFGDVTRNTHPLPYYRSANHVL